MAGAAPDGILFVEAGQTRTRRSFDASAERVPSGAGSV
jgi:hypothetical protein